MILGILLQATEAISDSTAMAGEMLEGAGEMKMSFLDLAMKGGWVLAILVILSIITVYIFVERFLTIGKASKEDKNFMNSIRDFIHEGRIDAAKTLAKNNDTPISRMIGKGLSRIGKNLSDINTAIENSGKLEVARLEKNVSALATISGAAPMLGFLGTVMGMIRVFYDMSMAGNNIDIALLSNGMFQAMVTTVAGLIVGIMAYVAYNVIISKIEALVLKLEVNATEFMDVLHEPAK